MMKVDAMRERGPDTPVRIATNGATPSRRLARQQGFLLIEAVVALAVLAIALAALLRTTSAAIGAADEARIRMLASELIHERVTAWQLGLLPAGKLPLSGEAHLAGQDVQWLIEPSAGQVMASVFSRNPSAAITTLTLPLP
jgi:general secretion pathway protein I